MFKVGDKIRAIKTDWTNQITGGKVYTVLTVEDSFFGPMVTIDGDRDKGVSVFAYRFEKVEKAKPGDFQARDTVVCVSEGSPINEITKGKTYVILDNNQEGDGDNSEYRLVSYVGDNGITRSCCAYRFKKAPTAQAWVPGDKVQVTGRLVSSQDGQVVVEKASIKLVKKARTAQLGQLITIRGEQFKIEWVRSDGKMFAATSTTRKETRLIHTNDPQWS